MAADALSDWLTEDDPDHEKHTREREWRKLQQEFHTTGYREGLSESRDTSMQLGFEEGFRQAGAQGFAWGALSGILSTLHSFYSKEKSLLSESLLQEIDSLHSEVVGISNSYLYHDSQPEAPNTSWRQHHREIYERVQSLCAKLQIDLPKNLRGLDDIH